MGSEYTPTPWFILGREELSKDDDFIEFEDKTYAISTTNDAKGTFIHNESYYNLAPMEKDAQHIVKCVNNHEAMKNMLDELVDKLEQAEFELVFEGLYLQDESPFGDVLNRAKELQDD